MSKSKWIMGVVSAAALIASVSASATTLEKMSFEAMVSSAAACVTGQAIGSQTIERDGQVYTQTQFRVTKTAFGSTGNVITIETPGGAKKMGRLNVSEVVAGAPLMFENQESVLLVAPDAASGKHTIVGFNQGILPVVDGAVVLPANFGGIQSVDKALDMIRTSRANPSFGQEIQQ